MPSEGFEVHLTRDAEKDLDEFGAYHDRVVDELLALENNPEKGHTLRGSLKGVRALEFSLPGSGVYRACYEVLHSDRVCLVFLIGPHENIYKKAERRLASLRRSRRARR